MPGPTIGRDDTVVIFDRTEVYARDDSVVNRVASPYPPFDLETPTDSAAAPVGLRPGASHGVPCGAKDLAVTLG